MHLISALASGIVGAQNGSVTLLVRGTATVATYYADFEATQASSGMAIALDANGSVVAYVNQFVDVRVLDVNGALIREFVAGDEAPAVEVISKSFTGIDYASGASGASKPTNLQVVLDAVFASFGTLDWKVLVAGTPTLLTAAVAGLAGLFFNVKSYGAIGDGVADDGAAIQAACNAAAATPNVGGIVFFPPGSYRTTTTLSVTAGVSWLGGGGTSTKVLFDNTSGLLVNGVSFVLTDSGSRLVQGIWFGATGVNLTVPLIDVGAGAAACVDFVGCITGGDSFTKGVHIKNSATGQGSRVTVTRCTGYQGADQSIYTQTSTGRMVVRDSDLLVTFAGAYSHAVIDGIDGLNVHDCRFDASAVTSGTIKYISFAPATWGSCVFTGNRFKANTLGVPPTCLYNALATPVYDCYEAGNAFGDTFGSGSSQIVAYGYATPGYANVVTLQNPSFHGSREGRTETFASNAAALTLDTDEFSRVWITRSTTAAQTLNPKPGKQGDRFLLMVLNSAGGACTITAGTHMILDVSLGASFTVANGATYCLQFEFMPNAGLTGAWIQVSGKSSNA